MPSRHVRPRRGAHRARRSARRSAHRRVAGLAVSALAGLCLVLALPGSAQAAAAGAADLAAAGSRTHTLVEFDLFRAFTDCLAEAAHGDSMYPGIDPSEVNACLGL